MLLAGLSGRSSTIARYTLKECHCLINYTAVILVRVPLMCIELVLLY